MANSQKVEHKLMEQQDNPNVDELNPSTPEVISRQATINLGTIGHVAHGKSTLVRSISGVKTIRHRSEMVRNITIKLGYANAKIYKCTECKGPRGYTSKGSAHSDTFPCSLEDCKGTMELQRHVSFVDCPGHDILMATMLNGAAVMDGALLLVAGNESCPQPQTSEHLAAVMIMKLRHIIILQNKIDLVKKAEAIHQLKEIKHFIKDTIAKDCTVIPISAQMKLNIDAVCRSIVTDIPIPVRDFKSPAKMIVIRSFDVNKPGEEIEDLRGGVAGGSILHGILKIGQPIEVRPGIISKNKRGEFVCTPIKSTIISLFAEDNALKYAVPGGLIGVGTNIDPTLTRADRLVGHVLGAPGTLPDVFIALEISYFLLSKLLGVKAEKGGKVTPLEKKEMLLVNIGSTSVGATIVALKADLAKLVLTQPVCTQIGERIALSRRIVSHFRLVGWGEVRNGEKLSS